MVKLFKKLFFQGDTWKIAYRRSKKGILEDKETPFKILEIPKGYWGADPFLIKKDNQSFLFFELTDFKKRKSLLACKNLDEENSKIKIVYEFPYHSSYPCIFIHKNEYYIIPETIQDRKVILLKCIEWPLKWEIEKTIFDDFDSVDSTIRITKNGLFLLTYDISHTGCFKTSIYEIKNFSKVKLVHKFETVQDIFRPAGNFIETDDGNYIRPVQPSKNFYGEKIVFLKGDENWKENEILSISFSDIKIDGKRLTKYIGIHTYNRCDELEVIDIAEMSFRPFKIFEFIFRKLNLFGYGLYDKRRKFIKHKLKNNFIKD